MRFRIAESNRTTLTKGSSGLGRGWRKTAEGQAMSRPIHRSIVGVQWGKTPLS
jgi:hypothetical protein